MQLTPADVHNVAFSRAQLSNRGYNEEEVDTFLDLVEVTLASHVEQSTSLQSRITQLEAQIEELQAAGVSTYSAVQPQPQAPIEYDESHAAELAQQAGRVMVRAQEVADQILVEAKTERERVIGDAQAEHNRLLTEANAEHDRLLTEANEQHGALLAQASQTAESIVSEGRSKHETLLADAQTQVEVKLQQANDHVESLRTEAERQHEEKITGISRLKESLENRVDELRGFEKDYRGRLRGHLEGLLVELGTKGTGSAAGTVTNPVSNDSVEIGNSTPPPYFS